MRKWSGGRGGGEGGEKEHGNGEGDRSSSPLSVVGGGTVLVRPCEDDGYEEW